VNNVRIKEDNDGHALIYMNQETPDNGFVKVKLEGVQSNRSAIGAQVELYADGRMLKREVTGGSSYLSNNSYVVHFGTGALLIDNLVVRWPGGSRQSFDKIDNNTFYYLRENEKIQLFEYGTTTSTVDHRYDDFQVYPNPATDQLTITGIDEHWDQVSVSLQSLSGKRVNYEKFFPEGAYKDQKHRIDISNFSTGLYLVCIIGKAKTHCKKVFIID
jgi:hypothetical protein